MAEIYTEAQVIAKIQAVDTEIERLLLSTASGGPAGRTPLKYRIGNKEFDLTSRVRMLMDLRKGYVDTLASLASQSVYEKFTIPDYEMSQFGESLGDKIDGDD